MCPYDHGADRIVVDEGPFNNPFPSVSTPMGPQMGASAPNTQFFGMPSGFGKHLCARINQRINSKLTCRLFKKLTIQKWPLLCLSIRQPT